MHNAQLHILANEHASFLFPYSIFSMFPVYFMKTGRIFFLFIYSFYRVPISSHKKGISGRYDRTHRVNEFDFLVDPILLGSYCEYRMTLVATAPLIFDTRMCVRRERYESRFNFVCEVCGEKISGLDIEVCEECV